MIDGIDRKELGPHTELSKTANTVGTAAEKAFLRVQPQPLTGFAQRARPAGSQPCGKDYAADRLANMRDWRTMPPDRREACAGRLGTKLDERLTRENRVELAQGCFDFLPHRALLDLAGWPDQDIFAHDG